MSDTRERTNSTHEAYLKRVVIPPIMIPLPSQASQQAQQVHRVIPRVERQATRLPPPENNLPTGAKGCLCGCAKITAGYIMCPLICSASCIAGAYRNMYHTVTCNKYNDGNDPHQLCTWFGCYNACVISSGWIDNGISDIQRKPHVEKDMIR